MPNLLLMEWWEGSLPNVVYGSSELLISRRWRHGQIIADHFWSRCIHQYLPSLQLRQKWHNMTTDIALTQVVRIVDSRAMWSVGKVTKVFPGGDGSVWFAEVQWKDRYYIHQVAKMVAMPKSNRFFCKECACCTNTGMAAENFLLSFEIHITHRPQYGHVAKLAQPPSFLLQ